MLTLRNPRHERFAQELATGKTADAAYVLAGYKENRSNAARLGADRDIQARVAEIQSVGAERAAITVESLIVEAEQARSKAMSEKGGAAAAVAAITAKAKLAGLWREKVAQTDPSGENGLRGVICLSSNAFITGAPRPTAMNRQRLTAQWYGVASAPR